MKYFIFLILFFSPILVNALTLTDVVQETISTHPQMKVKEEILREKEQELVNVKSGYLPTIDLSYSIGPEVTRTITNNQNRSSLTRKDATITLKQNLFSGFDTMNGVKQKKELILSASENVNETANSLAIESINAYLSVLKYSALYKTAQENVALHTKYLDQIKKTVEGGIGINSNYTQTLSRFENVTSEEYLAKLEYLNTISSYQRILPRKVFVEELEEPVLGKLKYNNLDLLIKDCIENNPIIKGLKSEIQASKALVARNKSKYYPTVDLVAQSYWNKNLNGISTNNEAPLSSSNYDSESGYNALVVFKYNIFNGFADKSNIEISKHKVLQNHNSLSDNERILKLNIEIAWNTYHITEKSLEHIKNDIQATSETVAYYQKEYELGRRSLIDLLNVSIEYNNAKKRKINAEFEQLLAYYKIMSYSNKLLSEMHVSIGN
ncbi:TolC family outer membrane protein [Arcobacter sp. F2176]|uniref:TolC family outer membrane protein n=1 Tax=Arcobacter sp. F2176 TaxID=2044511 RepID=UPI00100A6312|nr:TolC family outer membrane protein [Arcobacter sp. F2176]RXJ81251.1 agglutination protein [Arcobacter sp. F2176]